MASHPASSQKQQAVIRPADNSLRKKIGSSVAMRDIFTAERMQQCQKIVDQAMMELLQEMSTQLVLIGEEYTKAAEDTAYAETAKKKGRDMALALRKKMETLNFIFGFQVAASLHEYLQSAAAGNPANSDILLVVSKHIAVLNIIIKEGITGDGGIMGQELLANLRSLIKKSQK